MMVDISDTSADISEIRKTLDVTSEKFNVSINLQHKDVYEAMHRI